MIMKRITTFILCFLIGFYGMVKYKVKVEVWLKDNLVDAEGKMVEESLKAVGLWDELKDKLKKSALSLSLEQQQRLCIATFELSSWLGMTLSLSWQDAHFCCCGALSAGW